MNERILELADKAIEDMPGAWNIPDEFCKKFAELIVAEMLQTCEDHPGWSGRMIGEQIKQDFGVEE